MMDCAEQKRRFDAVKCALKGKEIGVCLDSWESSVLPADEVIVGGFGCLSVADVCKKVTKKKMREVFDLTSGISDGDLEALRDDIAHILGGCENYCSLQSVTV